MSALSLVNTVVNNNNFISLPTKVASILRKYGTDAHLYMPGVGYLNGFQVGNYLESTGSTNASVDGAVGLVLDAAGSVGPELIANPDFSAGYWYKNGVTVTGTNVLGFPAVGNEVSILSSGESSANKMYAVTAKLSGNGTISLGVTNNIDQAVRPSVSLTSTPTDFTVYCQMNGTAASNASVHLHRATGDTATTVTVHSLSCKRVTGTHATQATTANKPILRRGIVNLLTQNGDFSNAAWTRTNVNILGSVQAPDGSNTASNLNFVFVSPITRLYQDTTFQSVNGTRYTFAVWMRSATPCKISIGVQRNDPADQEQAEVDVTATWQLFVFSHSGAFTGTSAVRGVIFSYDAAFNKNIEVWRPGLFQGALTAQQILAAGGIPLTTTAPASSQYGAYAWGFDGTDDRLECGVPFQASDDFVILAAARTETAASYPFVFCLTDGAGSTSHVGLLFWQGKPRLELRGAGGFAAPPNGTLAVQRACVMTGKKVGNNLALRVDGVQVDTSATTAAGVVATFTKASIGARLYSAVELPLNGQVFAAIAIKGTVSDAELRVLEKWLGSIAGVPIA